MDLAASAADVAKYFQGQTDHEVDKLFWSQFNVPERPLPLTDQLAEWAELKRQLDAVDDDIELVNKRLDESQGK